MSYLARLKAEISEKRPAAELTKPTKGASVSFVGSVTCRLPESDAERWREAALAQLSAGSARALAAWASWEGEDEMVRVAVAERDALQPEKVKVTLVLIPRSVDPFAFLALFMERAAGNSPH